MGGLGMLRRKCAVLVGLVVVVCSTGLQGIAHAATVSCGQVITQDTTLDTDVGPCTGDGIIIGADNITLDLNGHTVFGSPADPTDTFSSGIRVHRFSGIRVRNGTVTGFYTGVGILSSANATLQRLVVRDNRCDGIVFAGVQAPPETTGGSLFEISVTGNGCAGMRLSGRVLLTTVERNVISDNAGPGIILQSLGGIGSSRVVTARGNSIVRNGADGIAVGSNSLFTTIVGNVIRLNRGNGIQIESGGQTTRVEGNRVLANTLNGVLVERFASARVVNNVALENGLGIVPAGTSPAYDLADGTSGCGGSTWAGNTFLTRNQPCIH